MFSLSLRSIVLLCSALTFILLHSAASHALEEPNLAQEPVVLKITIQDHRFSPTELHAPAGKPLAIAVTNNDDSTEEFESYDFDREQRIKAKETGTIKLGPMKPGRYPFFGDFHRKTAQGVLVVE
jgi:plastocyanin